MKYIRLACLLVSACICIGCNTISESSPITNTSSYSSSKEQWNGPLLIPSILPNDTLIESVRYLSKEKTFEVRMSNFYLFEMKTNEKSLPFLTHDHNIGETIDDQIRSVKQQNGHASPNNGILEIEKIRIGNLDGYWYLIQSSPSKKQVCEFIRDGIHVYVNADYSNELSKEQFLKTVNSFELEK